jgi:hypothetical protein
LSVSVFLSDCSCSVLAEILTSIAEAMVENTGLTESETMRNVKCWSKL